MMSESFYLSNISPQAQQFNRGIWEKLESRARAWARRDRGLYMVTGPVLKPGLETIGRQNEVAVPEQYYKVILYCNRPEIRMIGFLLRNEPSDESLETFVVPVSQIERATGLTFFPKLPPDLAKRLKNQGQRTMVADWF
jgi:endonuclease G, mitochondrial